METPGLLINKTKQEYFDILRAEYHNKKIILPEGKTVVFYFHKDLHCLHTLCGKGCNVINPMRAHRILWIKFVLENAGIREVKQNVWEPDTILFFCRELYYLIVCKLLPNGDLKYVTQHVRSKDFIKQWDDPKIYYPYTF